MISVKLTYEEKDSILVNGIFLEGSKNKIYKNASIDDKIFIYLYKNGKIVTYKTAKVIKVYENGCEKIRDTQKDKIHLLINNYILECEIVYYSWQRIEDIDDTVYRYRSHAEYKISNIYLCDENAKQTLKNYLIKALMIGVLDKHPGIREETIDKIIETCIRVDSIEKDKFEKLF